MTTTTRRDASPANPTLARPTAMRLAATEYAARHRPAHLAAHSRVGRADRLPGVGRARDGGAPARNGGDGGVHPRAEPSGQGGERRGGVFIDALTALQVEERAEHDAGTDHRAVREGGAQEPCAGADGHPDSSGGGPCRNARSSPAREEPWTIGYLIDVILTRDPWMHRIDTDASHRCRARAHGRARRRDRRRHREGVGRPARPAVHPTTDRAGRRLMERRRGRPRTGTRPRRFLPSRVEAPARRGAARHRSAVLIRFPAAPPAAPELGWHWLNTGSVQLNPRCVLVGGRI